MNPILSHQRYVVSLKTVAGESNFPAEEMTAPSKETTLPTIPSRGALKDITNVDEFGLFYQALRSKAMHFKGQKCSGGKHSKVRLTGLAADNAFLERLPLLAIGKSQNSR